MTRTKEVLIFSAPSLRELSRSPDQELKVSQCYKVFFLPLCLSGVRSVLAPLAYFIGQIESKMFLLVSQ